jgi:hypothetical protein
VGGAAVARLQFLGLDGLLIRNRFAVHWSRWHFAVLYTFLSVVNSYLGLWQKILFGKRVANTVIADPPIFIVGHWRGFSTPGRRRGACRCCRNRARAAMAARPQSSSRT